MRQEFKIPFSPPDITQEEIDAVAETLRSGWITTGPKTKQFEYKIAEYCGTKKSACLGSATAALELTLRVLGIGPGDEVITSAYTYTASASVIAHVGAKIVLVDTAKDSFHMNYEALADAVSEKTKAVIPVDIAGVMCDYDKIFQIVNEKKSRFHAANEMQERIGRVAVVADAAHSFGAEYKGRKSGSVADFTCFSFHAVKNLTTGEGGAVTWREIPQVADNELYKQYMLLSLHGQSKDALAKTTAGGWEYDILCPAYKCNMTDICASIGLAQLDRYGALLDKRREVIGYYDRALSQLPVTMLRHFTPEYTSSGHLYLMRLDGKSEQERNAFIRRMSEAGIATNVHYKPLPMHTAYRNMGFDIKDFPNAYEMYGNEVTLPLHTLLDDMQVKYVTNSILKIWRENWR